MFACIYIPDFPVAALVRAEPRLRERAVAVLQGKPPLVRVVAMNEKARQLGIDLGMTKMQAAIFAAGEEPIAPSASHVSRKNVRPSAVASRHTKSKSQPEAALLRQRSPAQEESAHASLLDIAHAFTPRVEDTAPDRLLLDLDGLEKLYGPVAAMARELASRVSAVGLDANLGLAANPDAAMYAACGFNGITVVPAGQEGKRLGVLPLSVLLDSFDILAGQKTSPAAARQRDTLRAHMLDTLERWGVRDFRTLALLPEPALAARLGEAGTRLQALARGAGMRTLSLCEPLTRFEESMELESVVETLEPLSFVLNRLLDQLCVRLEARALAVQELTLRLQLERRVADEQTTTLEELHPAGQSKGLAQAEDKGYTRTLRLPVAMRDPKVLLKLWQLELEAHPPGAPVCRLWISAEPAPPRSAQRGLFLPVTPEAEKLEITLARISGVVGEYRAGAAKLLNSHRPDNFGMQRFVAQPEGPVGMSLTMSDDDTGAPPLALRMFRPPRRLGVRLEDGRPCQLEAAAGEPAPGALQGIVLWSAGPWRCSGDWWAEPDAKPHLSEEAQAWDREEWDIALVQDDGNSIALYRIYRDAGTGHWFAGASYD